MSARTTLEALRVSGQGFLSELNVQFSPHLNCIIGARGTGKTSLLELIRFASGREADTDNTEAVLSRLIPVILGADGAVELDLTTPLGQQLTITRTVNGDLTAIDRDTSEAVDVDWPALGLYELAIFSQNQLEEIASDPAARLALVDSYCQQEVQSISRVISDVRDKLESNAALQIQLANEIEALKLQSDQLPKLNQEAQALEKQYKKALGDLKAQEPVKKRVSELSGLRQAYTRQDLLLSELVNAAQTASVEPFPGRMLGERLRSSLSEEVIVGLPSLIALRALRENIVESSQRYANLRTQMQNELGRTRELLFQAATATKVELHKTTAEYQQATAELGTASKTWKELAARREAAISQLRVLQSADAAIRQKEQQRIQGDVERKDLLGTLSAVRHERFLARKRAADYLNQAIGGAVLVDVTESAAVGVYQDFLLDQLRGSGLWYSRLASSISNRVPPGRLAELAQTGDADSLSALIETEPERSRRALTHLSAPKAVFELQTLEVDDSVTFRLRTGDGIYQESESLSQGQKCTTLLSILLVDSTNPLVIDQPEDNLDNSYVVGGVVDVVRQQKSSRQFIFVTHNPNVAVLGEAEKIIAMEAGGSSGRAALVGAWDEPAVKTRILTVMEGGRAAFDRRRAAYETQERARMAV